VVKRAIQIDAYFTLLCICTDVHGRREGQDDVSFHGYEGSVRAQSHQRSPQKSHLTSLSSISFTSSFELTVAVSALLLAIDSFLNFSVKHGTHYT